MPLYYFDIDNGARSTRDDTGLECANRDQIRSHAIGTLAEIANAELPDGDDVDFVVRVRDETGTQVFRAWLALHSEWTSPEEGS